MQILNRQTANLPKQRPEKILQFGGGNFLRAFADWMIDLLNEQTGFSGNVIIVKPTEKRDYTDLRRQEGLFHVSLTGLENGAAFRRTRLIQCVSRVIHPYREWSEFLASAENPDIRFIISNTTESGITFNENDRFGDAPPQEFPAKLTAWLHHRYQCFLGSSSKGCIFLPCELIENNGDALRESILQYAEAWQLGWDFQKWIFQYNFFCNTLVDRIVSGYPGQEAPAILEEVGFEDPLLVAGEYFHSWIIQAPEAVVEELPFNGAGLNVRLVDDLAPYRNMKVRLLNGAHTSMVPVGYLNGCRTVRSVMENPDTARFILEELREEIGPILPLAQAEIEDFIRATEERFRNPAIQHRLLSIALNSVSKYKTRLLPSLLEYQQKHQTMPRRIVFALASLIHFYKGNWNGEVIELKDDPANLDFFREVWADNGDCAGAVADRVLGNTNLWDQDLRSVPGLANTLTNFLEQISSRGVTPLLREWPAK